MYTITQKEFDIYGDFFTYLDKCDLEKCPTTLTTFILITAQKKKLFLFFSHSYYPYILGDQLNMSICFWYLAKRDLSIIHYFTVAYTIVTVV